MPGGHAPSARAASTKAVRGSTSVGRARCGPGAADVWAMPRKRDHHVDQRRPQRRHQRIAGGSGEECHHGVDQARHERRRSEEPAMRPSAMPSTLETITTEEPCIGGSDLRSDAAERRGRSRRCRTSGRRGASSRFMMDGLKGVGWATRRQQRGDHQHDDHDQAQQHRSCATPAGAAPAAVAAAGLGRSCNSHIGGWGS